MVAPTHVDEGCYAGVTTSLPSTPLPIALMLLTPVVGCMSVLPRFPDIAAPQGSCSSRHARRITDGSGARGQC